MSVEVEKHHGWDMDEQKTVFKVHYVSQLDEALCESIDVLALRVERVDLRTVSADGITIRFAGDIVEITSVI